MDLSVIIVNWNTGSLLKKCIESIYQKTQNLDFEVIVVDNASNDNSVSLAKKTCLDFKLIQNKENLGFAAANNQGAQKAKGEYLIFLNPDTELKNDALLKMVSFLRENPKVKILGPKLLNSDGTVQKSVRAFPKFLDQVLILLKVHHFLPKLKPLQRYFLKKFNYEKSQEVDQVMGAALMIRKKDFEKLGRFDEKFYIWFEEVDLCKRAKKSGGEVYYFKTAKITHHGAVSFSQRLSFVRQWLFTKSMLYYFKKHTSFIKYLGLVLVAPFGLLLSLPFSFPKKKVPFFYLGFTGVTAISLFLFLFFSQKAGLLFLVFSFIGFLAFQFPRPATLTLVAFLPFLPILKDAEVIPVITLIKDFLIVALFAAVIYKNFKNKKIIFLLNSFSILVVLLVLWGTVSFFFADNKVLGLLRLRDIVLYILAFFIIFDFIRNKNDLKKIVSILLIAAIFVLLLAPLQLFFFKDSMVKRFDPATNTWHSRIASSLAHPSIFGEYLVIIFSLAASLLIFKRPPKSHFVILTLITLFSIIFLYLTFSRGAWLGGVAAGAAILFFLKNKIAAQKKLLLSLGILLILATYLVMFHTKAPTYLATLIDRRYKSNEERLYMVYSLIGESNTTTNIFGKGLGDTTQGREAKKIGLTEIFSFESQKIKEAKAKTLVDNQYLKTFSEMGLVGIAILLGIFYFLIKTAYKLIKITDDKFLKAVLVGILAAGVAFIVQGLAIDIFEIFPTNILFWTLAGVLMAVYYKNLKLKIKKAK